MKILIHTNNKMFNQSLSFYLKKTVLDISCRESTNGKVTSLIERHRPDILLMEATSNGSINDIEVNLLRKKFPDLKTLLLVNNNYDDRKKISDLSNGVKGHITDDMPLKMLCKAIRSVHMGQLWVERRISSRALEYMHFSRNKNIDGKRKKFEKLTGREKEILSMLAAGESNEKIAETLFISVKTVKTHLYRVYKKLGVSSRLQAVLAYIEK